MNELVPLLTTWWLPPSISQTLEVSLATIGRVRQQFVEQSFTAALERRLPRGQRLRRLDGEAEAHLIALACSSAPAGHVAYARAIPCLCYAGAKARNGVLLAKVKGY